MERVPLRRQLPPPEADSSPPKKQLSLRDAQFVIEYLRDYNATQALIRAGGSPRSAGTEGHNTLKKPEVQDAILAELEARRARSDATIDEVCSFHYELANADPRNLMPVKYGACRHCWGEGHEYQETQIEQEKRRLEYLLERQKFYDRWERDVELRRREAAQKHRDFHEPERPAFRDFDMRGGIGYNKFADPMRGPEWYGRANVNSASSCPECNGAGIAQLLPIDMSKWTWGETLLFNGMVVRRDGSIEVRLNDRVRSLDRFAELRGFVRPKLPVRDFDWDRMSDDALDAAVEEALRRGLVRQEDLEPPTIEGNAIDVTPEKEPVE